MAGDDKLHVVMFPWLAFGHMIPFLGLSEFIAQKGHKVSFVSTPRNIDRLPKLPPNLAPLINLVKLPLPPVDGLPQHAEATMDLHPDDVQYLKKAFDGLQTGLARFLEDSAADWIIYDFAPHWLPPIAAKLGISRAFFSIFNAWFVAFYGSSSQALIDGSDERTNPEDFMVAPKWVPFPTNVAYRPHEIKWILETGKSNASEASDRYRVGSVIMGCDVFFIRHCMEFEPDWVNLLEDLHQRPVIPIGLMPPTVQDSGDVDQNETWLSIREWLDTQSKGCVVYVALGSEITLSQEEITELALGLELSGLPFLWALRKPPAWSRSDSLVLPDGFVERTTGGRGLICTRWVPQLKILDHDSVGAFLTHCGWSSIIEGIMFGKPLIMLPFLVDQGLNARVLVRRKVGVEVGRDEKDGSFTRNSLAESLKQVVVDSEGRTYRDKAKEMGAIFGDKDLHNQYLDNFIEYIEKHRRLYKG